MVKTPPLAFAICALFVGLSLAADGWDTKRIHGSVGPAMIEVFAAPWTPSLDTVITPGHCAHPHDSYPYRVVVGIISWVLSRRTICLRAVSVFFGAVTVWLLYHLGATLYDRKTGLLFTLLVATSPFFVEMMRAYGFVSMTAVVVVAILLLSARALPGETGRESPGLGWVALHAALCLSTLSLYAVGRLVILVPLVGYLGNAIRGWRQAVVFLAVLLLPLGLITTYSWAVRGQVVEALLVGPEWMSNPGQYQPAAVEVESRVTRNAVTALAYVTHLRPVDFSDFGADPRLYPLAFAPFLLVGAGACLRRRRPADLIILSSLVAFLGVPLLSSGLPARRVVFLVIPISLLVARGAVVLQRAVFDRYHTRVRRWLLLALASVWLIAPVGLDIHAFITKISRPWYDASERALGDLAAVSAVGARLAGVFTYEKQLEGLVFGNPALVDGDDAPSLTRIVFQEQLDPVFWSPWSIRTGKSIAYLYESEGACSDTTLQQLIRGHTVDIQLTTRVVVDRQTRREPTRSICGMIVNVR